MVHKNMPYTRFSSQIVKIGTNLPKLLPVEVGGQCSSHIDGSVPDHPGRILSLVILDNVHVRV